MTDLVDDGEDGVEQHEVLFLDREVLVLLQGKQHRSYQGDLSGAAQTKVKRSEVNSDVMTCGSEQIVSHSG